MAIRPLEKPNGKFLVLVRQGPSAHNQASWGTYRPVDTSQTIVNTPAEQAIVSSVQHAPQHAKGVIA